MALQVWLPLTKDTRNQGLLTLPTPWDARSRDTGGKLGQYCYSDNAIYHIENEWLGNEWSLACWVKSSSWAQYNDIILCKNTTDSTAAQLYLSIIGGTRLNIGCNAGSQTLTVNYTFATNTWYHIAATYSGTTLKLYLNGSEVGTKAYTSTQKTGMNNLGIGCRSTNAAGTSATGGASKRMNDVRIYDHCLSSMEVKQLSQGLILHYPLNRQGWGQENLATCNTVSWTWNSTTANYNYQWVVPSNTLTIGETYTVSAIVETTEPTKYVTFLNYHTSPATTYGPQTNIFVADGQTRFSWTFTAGATGLIAYAGVAGKTANQTAIYKNIKLEKGSIATPWCPNSSDALATTMGLNSTTEYDCSGFCNNGTRTGTFTWTSDTPKYTVSQVFNGTDNAIQTPNLTTMVTDKNYTVACWTYKTVIGTKNYQTIYGGPSGFELEARSSSSTSPLYRIHNWGGGTTPYNFGEWTHFCFVHTDSDSKLYVNGELKISGTSANIPSGNYFVGAWKTSTSQNYEGLMSDFRIYATALSASDVKSLYQNSAYVDSSGNVYGAVHTEV